MGTDLFNGGHGAITHENLGAQSPEPGRSDTLQDGKRRTTSPKEKIGPYSDNSATIEDEKKLYSENHEDTQPARNSSSTIDDVEKQDRGTTETAQADQLSNDSYPDLEKGETASREHEEASQNGTADKQARWENNVVDWDGPNNSESPMNWKKSKKYTVTVFYSSLTFCITIASSVFSTATMVTAKEFGVFNEVITLGTSLFVFVSASSYLYLSSSDKSIRASPLA